jgi:hypothetical protein
MWEEVTVLNSGDHVTRAFKMTVHLKDTSMNIQLEDHDDDAPSQALRLADKRQRRRDCNAN